MKRSTELFPIERQIVRNCGTKALEVYRKQGWVVAPVEPVRHIPSAVTMLRLRFYPPSADHFWYYDYSLSDAEIDGFSGSLKSLLENVEKGMLAWLAKRCEEEGIRLTLTELEMCLRLVKGETG